VLFFAADDQGPNSCDTMQQENKMFCWSFIHRLIIAVFLRHYALQNTNNVITFSSQSVDSDMTLIKILVIKIF